MPASWSQRGIVLVTAVAWGVSHVLSQRLLAGYCGPGLLLSSTAFTVLGLALALGVLLGAHVRRPRAGVTGVLLALAGAWFAALPWARDPAMRALDGLGLANAVRAGMTLFFAPPLVLSGIAIGRAMQDSSSRAPERTTLETAALALVAAIAGALLAAYALVPGMGVARTAGAAGLLLILGAAQAWMRTGRPAAIFATGLTLIAAIVAIARAPVAREAPELGLLDIRRPGATELRVFERDEARYLIQDGTVLAVADARTFSPLGRAAVVLDLTRLLFDTPGSALVAGMRDGGLARFLAAAEWKVQVVDSDPRRKEVAQRYFGWTQDGIPVVTGDPRRFLRQSNEKWDLLVFDAFAAAPLPTHLLTRESFTAAAAHLSDQGVLALALEARGWDDPLVGAVGATLHTVFQHVAVLPTSEPPNTLGTLVFLAANRPIDFPEGRLENPSGALGDNYEHWVSVQKNHGWQNRFDPVGDAGNAGLICTDDRNPAEIWMDRIDQASRQEVHEFFGPYARIW